MEIEELKKLVRFVVEGLVEIMDEEQFRARLMLQRKLWELREVLK